MRSRRTRSPLLSVATARGLWKVLRWRLEVVKCTVFLMAMTTLDIRDLWYKIEWVGPFDSYSFKAGSHGILKAEALPVITAEAWASMATAETKFERGSGWGSFFSRCETLTPFCDTGSTFFLSAMGSSCSVDVLNATQKIPQLVMTSNVRSDSMAWAACQLLYDHRKPLLCAQPIVTAFYERYRFRVVPVSSILLTAEGSSAEIELLNLLSLIARSAPRQKMICTSGFAHTTPGIYQPSIYGCASANLYEAAFVGLYATQFYDLQYNLAWLATMDVVSVVGLTYGIRENSINQYNMTKDADTLHLTEFTTNNFVSYGLLYLAMVIIDAVLLLAQMYTGYELVQQWIVPVMKNHEEFERRQEEIMTRSMMGSVDEDQAVPEPDPILLKNQPTVILFSREEYVSFLSTSLFRHRTFVILTVITQLISWGIIIPNSIVWTWSLSSLAKLQGYLSTLRLWGLIVILVNAVWDIVVLIDEKRAFAIARVVYISPFEVIAIGAICAYNQRELVMNISETKFAFERQRLNDLETFPGYIAHGNTFNIDLDGSFGFDLKVLRILYEPLLTILWQSCVGVIVWLAARYVLPRALSPLSRLGCTRPFTSRIHISSKTMPTSDDNRRDESEHDEAHQAHVAEKYTRTILEKLLNMPMRARSLVRPAMSMHKVVNNEIKVRPHISIDFGVFISHRVVTARTGFASIIPAKTRLPTSSDFGKSLRFSQTTLGNGESEADEVFALRRHMMPLPRAARGPHSTKAVTP